MPRYDVYHLTDELAMIRHRINRDAHPEPEFPRDYAKVATVEAANLNHAFCLTDNHDASWARKPEVADAVAPDLRNTSVGDIYIGDDGAHRIESIGFSRIRGWEPERLDMEGLARAADEAKAALEMLREPHQEDFSW